MDFYTQPTHYFINRLRAFKKALFYVKKLLSPS